MVARSMEVAGTSGSDGTDDIEPFAWSSRHDEDEHANFTREQVARRGSFLCDAPGESFLWYVGAPEDLLGTPEEFHQAYEEAVDLIREMADLPLAEET